MESYWQYGSKNSDRLERILTEATPATNEGQAARNDRSKKILTIGSQRKTKVKLCFLTHFPYLCGYNRTKSYEKNSYVNMPMPMLCDGMGASRGSLR